MVLAFTTKPFAFELVRPLQTSQGFLKKRCGWLLRLEDSSGKSGWGEVSTFNLSKLKDFEDSLDSLGSSPTREELEEHIKLNISAPQVAFGIGACLAELDGLVGETAPGGWLKPSCSAFLINTSNDLLFDLEQLVERCNGDYLPLTLKWKVAVQPDDVELSLFNEMVELIPKNFRIRLDANGGWNRLRASRWVEHLFDEPRLEWIEQPLPVEDLEGLFLLDERLPVALDESLLFDPTLRISWKGWQVRRPIMEGDPRPLLRDLQNGFPLRTLSTSFETGIGLRWLHHLAALQQKGPTPTAPGLASGWCASSGLFSSDPELVWNAA